MSSTKGLKSGWWKPEGEATLSLLRALPRLEGPELLLPTEGVRLPPGVPVGVGVGVGVVPAVDVGVAVGEGGTCVGDGEGAGEGVLVTVGVTGTGVCPTGVGTVPPPVPLETLVGVAPGAVAWAGADGTVLP